MANKLKEIRENLSSYKAFFTELYKFKDKEVIEQILEVINGKKVKKEMVETGTQYDECDFQVNITITHDAKKIPKRKNKRKQRGPMVEKSEPEIKKLKIQNEKNLIEKTLKDNQDTIKSKNKYNFTSERQIRGSIDEESSIIFDEFINKDDDSIAEELWPLNKEYSLKKLMIDEFTYLMKKHSDDGLVPTDLAILCDVKKLRRQFYILKFMNINISDILSLEDNLDILKCALLNKCNVNILINIIKECPDLLEEKDECDNNIIHWALIQLEEHEQIDLFKILVKFFLKEEKDIKHFKEKNDDGETILHTSIAQNKPVFCHLIIEALDGLLNIKKEICETLSPDSLKTHYILNKIQIYNNNSNSKYSLEKRKIINNIDLKHSQTPIHLAVKTKNELFIRMFLSNLGDPYEKGFCPLTAIDQCEGNPELQSIIVEYNNI